MSTVAAAAAAAAAVPFSECPTDVDSDSNNHNNNNHKNKNKKTRKRVHFASAAFEHKNEWSADDEQQQQQQQDEEEEQAQAPPRKRRCRRSKSADAAAAAAAAAPPVDGEQDEEDAEAVAAEAGPETHVLTRVSIERLVQAMASVPYEKTPIGSMPLITTNEEACCGGDECKLCCKPYTDTDTVCGAYACGECYYHMCLSCTAAHHQETQRRYTQHQFCPQCRAPRDKFVPFTVHMRATMLARFALQVTCRVCHTDMPLHKYTTHRLHCYNVQCRAGSSKCSFVGPRPDVEKHEPLCRKFQRAALRKILDMCEEQQTKAQHSAAAAAAAVEADNDAARRLLEGNNNGARRRLVMVDDEEHEEEGGVIVLGEGPVGALRGAMRNLDQVDNQVAAALHRSVARHNNNNVQQLAAHALEAARERLRGELENAAAAAAADQDIDDVDADEDAAPSSPRYRPASPAYAPSSPPVSPPRQQPAAAANYAHGWVM